MAKRRLKNPWASASLQRSMTALTRSAWRTGSRLVDQAVKSAIKSSVPKPSPRLKPSRAAPVLWPERPPVRRPAGPVKAPARPTRGAHGEMAGSWTRGIALGPAGARSFHLYQPPGLRRTAPAPLLVMLHGCTQTAQSFALSTRMNRLAVTIPL